MTDVRPVDGASASGEARKPGEAASSPWRPYQFYAVGLVLLIIICNYADRGMLAYVQEPMKHELGLSDSQLGLLGGPAFGLFYTVCGIPIARLAERANRARLLAGCIAFWSMMTALCGAAGNFTHLIIARMGVGAGEGGCIPISHSVMADSFTVRQRGRVMSVIAAGVPIANIITPMIVGAVVVAFGWRSAFFAIGLPGLLLALLVWTTLKEPRAERAVAPETAQRKKMGAFLSDIAWLARTSSFVCLFVGGGAIGAGISALQLFKISYLARVQGFSLAEAATLWSVAGVFGLVGTFLGGFIADRYADARGRSYVLIPAVGGILTFALLAVCFTASSPMVAAGCLMLSQLTYNLKNGPIYAAVQNIVPPYMRSTGAAIHMFAATTIGTFVGPPLAGRLSDTFAATAYGADMGAYLRACPGGKALAGASDAAMAACTNAAAVGLREALLVISLLFALGGIFYFLASRKIQIASPD